MLTSSASLHASFVIAKAKVKTWQATWSSLSPKSNPESEYSLLQSVTGSFSSFFSSSNFPTVTLPESRLRSASQPKTLRRKARCYLSELRQATCPKVCHSFFCFPFSPAEFLAAANLSSSTATGPDKVAYSVLKHLPRSDMDFLLHIFNLSWSLHFFPSIWIFLLFLFTK